MEKRLRLVDSIFGEDGIRLITNFDKKDVDIFETAIELYGGQGLYIDKKAYDRQGRLIDGCYALKLSPKYNPYTDLTGFWKIFYSVREKKKIFGGL